VRAPGPAPGLRQLATLVNKAQAATALGQYQEAFSCCSLALEIDPRNVRAYHRRAVALQGMQELQAARQDLETILYLEPGHQEAAQMLQALPAASSEAHEMEDEIDTGERSSSVGARGGRSGRRKSENRIAGLKNEGATCYLNVCMYVCMYMYYIYIYIYICTYVCVCVCVCVYTYM